MSMLMEMQIHFLKTFVLLENCIMSLNECRIHLLDSYGILYIGESQFLFDLDDLKLLESRTWFVDDDGYLVSYYLYHRKIRYIRFHRLVVNAQANEHVDHINRNRADNRKSNLRRCSCSDNYRNKGLYRNNSSGITGIYFDKRRHKWAAHITYQSKKIFLGRFQDKQDAIRVRRLKESELFGEYSPNYT